MRSNINEALDWRYATKKFDASKKISETDWKVLQNALVKAPSSYGLQPFKFIVVENPEVRQKLREVSWNQAQVTDASHYVVFAAKENLDEAYIEKYIQRIADVRGVPPETLEGFKNSMVDGLIKSPRSATLGFWAQRQAYIAMGFLMETAALLNIDACPMEGFDPAAYDKILKLEGTGWKAVSTVAVGYRHPDDAYQNLKKVRFDDETLLEFVK